MSGVHRCAVYTRKSTEEGLDQAFNSLHAQREACEAYIKSQAAEGWKLEKKQYDDGGYSGGTLERPALQALLQDIDRGIVNIVVVYKIDRLSRSLADFAKLVELFEQKAVTFVSVTQHFNTTTSMGRLTLNVLLSFAQFEREVTGERIRDKITASKRKGMWMGGTIPFGYDVRDRKLVTNPAEAKRVGQIFARYLELGSVGLLADELRRQGVRSKVRVSASGARSGGCVFRRGQLYTLLRNRTYIGEIAHKGNVYKGDHESVIDRQVWTSTQELLATNRRKDRGRRAGNPKYLLTGLLYDDRGNPMTPQHTQKSGNRRYSYYVSQALIQHRPKEAGSVSRISAKEIEAIVEQNLLSMLSPSQTALWATGATLERREIMRSVISRIDLHSEELVLTLASEVNTDRCSLTIHNSGRERIVRILFTAYKRGGQTQIHVASGHNSAIYQTSTSITKAIARAWKWRQWFEADEVRSLAEVAKREQCTEAYVRKLLPLAFLAPGVIQAAIDGTLPRQFKISDLATKNLPMDWNGQRRRLGFPG